LSLVIFEKTAKVGKHYCDKTRHFVVNKVKHSKPIQFSKVKHIKLFLQIFISVFEFQLKREMVNALT